MKVLIIDGPARGMLIDTEAYNFKALGEPRITGGMPPSDEIAFRQITYHVHKLILLGRMLRVASTHTLAEEISEADAFEYVASSLAKEAAT